jgi:anti-anti-sigma regulatory factor
MTIRVERHAERPEIAIVRVEGALDAATYREVIAAAQKAHEEGARTAIVDLSATTYLSSSGLVALHTMALLFRGNPPPEGETGWRALRRAAEAAGEGEPPGVRLVSPQARVRQTLELSGMIALFSVHASVDEAVDGGSATAEAGSQKPEGEMKSEE